MRTRVRALCAGILAALVALLTSFALFHWALVAYWEWQHEGRRMKFTLWADERALPLALLLSSVVFHLSVRYLQRNAPLDQKAKGRSLLIGAALGMVVVYLAVVVYLWMVVSRFSS